MPLKWGATHWDIQGLHLDTRERRRREKKNSSEWELKLFRLDLKAESHVSVWPVSTPWGSYIVCVSHPETSLDASKWLYSHCLPPTPKQRTGRSVVNDINIPHILHVAGGLDLSGDNEKGHQSEDAVHSSQHTLCQCVCVCVCVPGLLLSTNIKKRSLLPRLPQFQHSTSLIHPFN